MTTPETPHWQKSSYSENGGVCVEVAVNLAATRHTVPVRDSKNANGPVLDLSARAFTAFVTSLRTT
ncbi:DUF397 domain-containing protein [Streptomyces sp. JNUCC 64]